MTHSVITWKIVYFSYRILYNNFILFLVVQYLWIVINQAPYIIGYITYIYIKIYGEGSYSCITGGSLKSMIRDERAYVRRTILSIGTYSAHQVAYNDKDLTAVTSPHFIHSRARLRQLRSVDGFRSLICVAVSVTYRCDGYSPDVASFNLSKTVCSQAAIDVKQCRGQ